MNPTPTESPYADVFPPDVMAELMAAADNAARGIRDPEAARRACERTDRAREEILRREGIPSHRRTRDPRVARRTPGMRYVLDGSVAFDWVIPETDNDQSIALRDDTARPHQRWPGRPQTA